MMSATRISGSNRPLQSITLRRYQQRVVDEFANYLQLLRTEQDNPFNKHAANDAWKAFMRQYPERAIEIKRYAETETGDERDLPNLCLLVPTGGGKTLLATQIIAEALRILLPEREGGGLVLWLVPAGSIYDQTRDALRDPKSLLYRALRERTGSRIKLWQKEDIGSLSPAILRSDLNILLLMLQSVNRAPLTPEEEAKGRKSDYLRYFRDGRVRQDHFPPENDEEAHIRLRQGYTDHDGIVHDGTINLQTLPETNLVRTSLANLVRLSRPIVIVDEQQKAASQNARNTLAQLNPALLVQLSATPKQTNVLVRVSGLELLQEEMIKLPIAVHSEGIGDWQRCLSDAHCKQIELEQAAERNQAAGGKYIRPIVVVQAERTGKDQENDARYTHSEDVRKYLTVNLGVPKNQIAVQTSEIKELEGVDLLSEACPIRWIVTRDALKEGWDCPFAYLLVTLLNTESLAALTQLVGRVLRQPYQSKTSDDRLNRCYVYTRHKETDKTINAVKKALNDSGLEGDNLIYTDQQGIPTGKALLRDAFFTQRVKREAVPPIEDRILLPRFCIRTDDSEQPWEPLNWYTDLLAYSDMRDFSLEKVGKWRLEDELKKARDRYTLVTIGELMPRPMDEEISESVIESDEATRAWIALNVDLPYYSVKERLRLTDRILQRLLEQEPNLAGRLALVRYRLRDNITALIHEETDRFSEVRFRDLQARGQMGFTLLYEQCQYEIIEPRRRKGGAPIQFDYQDPNQMAIDFDSADEYNGLERQAANTFDRDEDVFWWYRNITGEFGIQGWRRNRIYPDFVLQMRYEGKSTPAFLIVETKGRHLDRNLDTTYKEQVAQCFTDIGERVPWQHVKTGNREAGSAMESYFLFRVLKEEENLQSAWQDQWKEMKEECFRKLRPVTGSATLLRRK